MIGSSTTYVTEVARQDSIDAAVAAMGPSGLLGMLFGSGLTTGATLSGLALLVFGGSMAFGKSPSWWWLAGGLGGAAATGAVQSLIGG